MATYDHGSYYYTQYIITEIKSIRTGHIWTEVHGPFEGRRTVITHRVDIDPRKHLESVFIKRGFHRCESEYGDLMRADRWMPTGDGYKRRRVVYIRID